MNTEEHFGPEPLGLYGFVDGSTTIPNGFVDGGTTIPIGILAVNRNWEGIKMGLEVVLFVAGGVVGLVTGGGWGYFFERRAKKVAQKNAREEQQNAQELQQDVKKLSNALYDQRFHVGTDNRGAPAGRPQGPLTAQIVLKRARDTQDENGHVEPKELIAHFLALGYPMQEIDPAFRQLSESGELKPDNSSLAVQ